MKPLKIEMQAFGPYLHKTEIDFTALYKYGLFLITGATGCGKTTILDAMSYALYGRSSGSLRDVRDMRTIAAPDTLETHVSFEMELSPNKYKFERAMKIRQVKKHSGEKERVTDYEENCFVFENDGWRLLCSGTQVKDKAAELLGFSHEQFSQVVVLPQGEFRKLLTAPSLEKQKILETLFGTARWQRFTKLLSQHAKALGESLEKCIENTATLCRSVDCENPKELAVALEKSKSELVLSENEMKASKDVFNKASAALGEGSQTESKFEELQKTQEKLAQLAKDTEKIAKKRTEAELAEKAAALLPYYEALKKAGAALETAVSNKKSAELSLDAVNKEAADAKAALDSLTDGDAQLKALDGTILKLEGILGPARALSAACAELREKDKSYNDLTAKLSRENELVKKLTENLESVKAGITALNEKYVLHLPELVEQKNALETRVTAFLTLESQKKATTEIEKRLNKKRGEYKSASQLLKNEKNTLENMQHNFDADSAYRLAQNLADGEKCPVCGSCEHPFLAAGVHGAPSKEDIETQKKIVEDLEDKFGKIKEDGARIHGEFDAASKRLSELAADCEKTGLSAKEAAEKLAESKAALLNAQNAAKRQRELETQAKTAEDTLEKAKKRQDTLKSLCDKEALELSKLKGQAAQLSKAVPENRRDARAVELRISSLKKSYEDLSQRLKNAKERCDASGKALAAADERLASASKTEAEAIKNRDAEKSNYSRRFQKSGIDDGTDIEKACLSKELLKTLQDEIASFDRETFLQTEREKALGEQLSGVTRPDMTALKEKEASARGSMEKALAQKGAFDAKIKSLESITLQLGKTAELEKKLRQDYALYERIFRLANGDNPLKTPIHQFVLGLMLDDIVVCANEHLSFLSRGRYALVRSAAPSRGGGTKGLDLSVDDAWSGGERGVNTLSGGEMFLASLSLAFGLSDVVQSYSGGIRLDSLFIDEGFGSLDSETLDTAMGALEHLRLSGRLIGVISHVGGLRERIPAHIAVKRLADGTAGVNITAP